MKLLEPRRFMFQIPIFGDDDLPGVPIEHAVDKPLSLMRLPLPKRIDRVEFGNSQRADSGRRHRMREAASHRLHFGNEAGLESLDPPRRFQIDNAQAQPPRGKSR